MLKDSAQQGAPIHLDAIKSTVKGGLIDGWKGSLSSATTRAKLGGECKFPDLKLSSQLSRHDQTLLSQLRTGQCRLLGEFRKTLCKDKWDGMCRWCKKRGQEESVDHVFNGCTKLVALKRQEGVDSSDALFLKPTQSVAFVNKALALINGDGVPSGGEAVRRGKV